MIALALFVVALALVIIVVHTFWWIAGACAVALATWAAWRLWELHSDQRVVCIFQRHLEETGGLYRSATAAHAEAWAAGRRASWRLRGR